MNSKWLNIALIIAVVSLAGHLVIQNRAREPKMGRIPGLKVDIVSSDEYRYVLEACAVVDITEAYSYQELAGRDDLSMDSDQSSKMIWQHEPALVVINYRIGIQNISGVERRGGQPRVQILDSDGFVLGTSFDWVKDGLEGRRFELAPGEYKPYTGSIKISPEQYPRVSTLQIAPRDNS